jgi:hypothetical protein
VILYADDNAPGHNPGLPLSSPLSLAAASPPESLPAGGSPQWVQIDVSAAGWPLLEAETYYWIVLAPSSPISIAPPNGNGNYDGIVWAGVADASGFVPYSIANDPTLYTARSLSSQRFAFDTVFGGNTQTAVQFLGATGADSWPAVVGSNVRYTNWALSPRRIRYGINVFGWQFTPSGTPTPSRECVAVDIAGPWLLHVVSPFGHLSPSHHFRDGVARVEQVPHGQLHVLHQSQRKQERLGHT